MSLIKGNKINIGTISNLGFVLEIARFLGVFGRNTASDISKFTKISREERRRVIFGEF